MAGIFCSSFLFYFYGVFLLIDQLISRIEETHTEYGVELAIIDVTGKTMLLCLSVAVLHAVFLNIRAFSTMVHPVSCHSGDLIWLFVNAVSKSEFILRAFSLFYSF